MQVIARHTVGPACSMKAVQVRPRAEIRNSWENVTAEPISVWDRWVGQRRGIAGNGSDLHSSTLTQYKGFPLGPFQLFKCESTELATTIVMTKMRRMKAAVLH